VYRRQVVTTAGHRDGKNRTVEDYPQVGLLYKSLIEEAVKSRKQRKLSATWYLQEAFNPVLNPYLHTEIFNFLSSRWIHTDTTIHLMNV
jgi:hypothetical protein